MDVYFPQYIGRPLTFWILEPDDAGIGIIGLLFAYMFGGFFWLTPILLPYAYMKAKSRYPRSFLKHTFYFMGFTNLKFYPSYFENEFLE